MAELTNQTEIKEVVLWENTDSTGIFHSGSIAVLNDSIFNYDKILLIGGFNDVLNDRQVQDNFEVKTLKDGLIIYTCNAGSNHYEMQILNNGLHFKGLGYAGNGNRFLKIIGIKGI